MLKLFISVKHGWSIRFDYSREFVHFPHNPQPSPFTNKVMAKLSLSSPSTFRIRPFHKFLQMAVPRWGFPLSTRLRQSPYILWLHWKLLTSGTWQTSLIPGRPSSTKYHTRWPDNQSAQKKTYFILKGIWEEKLLTKELSNLENFLALEPPIDIYIAHSKHLEKFREDLIGMVKILSIELTWHTTK